MQLKDKVAIITGASQGIGEAFAKRFAAEGAKVVVVNRRLERGQKVADAIKEAGGQALAVAADISDDALVKEMAAKVVEQYGQIDILMNNAALYYGVDNRAWDDWESEDWDKMFAVNVRGTWQVIRAVAPQMIKQNSGKIINVASGTADIGWELLLPYSCSKAGIITLTKAMARALGQYNIKVNCISPGYVLTEASLIKGKGLTSTVGQPGACLKKPAESDDMVGTALFLASSESDFVTGQTIAVNGGTVMR